MRSVAFAMLLLLGCSTQDAAQDEPPSVAEAPPAPSEAAPASSTPDTSEDPMPATLPTPYTAKQIQDAMPPGTQVVTRHAGPDGVTLATWSVLSNGDEGLVMETSSRSEDGTVLQPPTKSGPAPWEALRTHAEFPVEGTTESREEVTVPFGTFPARKYVVEGTDEQGRATVRTFWFADAIPGPPVRMTVAVDGAQVSESTMVERTGHGE